MAEDLIELIKQDHREIERLFDQLDRHPARRPLMVPTLSALLTAHHRAEEQEVYPVIRQAGATDAVAHAQREHLRAEQLLERVADTDLDDAAFDSILTALADLFADHARAEEQKVLPALEQLDQEQRAALAEALLRSRTRHYGDRPQERRLADLRNQAGNLGVVAYEELAENQLARLLRDLADE